MATFLQNDWQETRTKELDIVDFEPKTLASFLKFMYVEAVQALHIDINLLQIAHKYNVTNLFEICDEFLANNINCHTPLEEITNYMTIAEMLEVPKITGKLIQWKKLDRSHDKFWTDFVSKNPRFAQMVAKIIGTEANALWWENRASSNVAFSRFTTNIVILWEDMQVSHLYFYSLLCNYLTYIYFDQPIHVWFEFNIKELLRIYSDL